MKYRFGLNFLFVLSIAGLLSCKSNYICPAFQSTYILDDSLRLLAFSPFGADSMPKYGPRVRKDKNGIIVHESYYRKNYELRTVKMQNQYVPRGPELAPLVQDSIAAPDSVSLIAVADSSVVDKPATAPASKPAPKKYLGDYDPKDNFNEEQVFYNKHFGELFVAPPQKAAPADSIPAASKSVLPADSSANGSQKEKKGLLRKRNKTTTEEPPIDEADTTGTGF